MLVSDSGSWVLVLDRAAETAAYGAAGAIEDLPAQPELSDAQWAAEARILDSADVDLSQRVTRGQMSILLYRFARWAGADLSCTGDLSAWPDGASVPEWSKAAYSWGLESGILSTVVEEALSPDMPVSRGQAALILTALVARLGEELVLPDTAEERVPLPTDGASDAASVPDGGAAVAENAPQANRPLADDALAEQAAYGTVPSGTAPSGGVHAAEASWYEPGKSPEAEIAAEIAGRAAYSRDSASRTKHQELQASIDAIAKRYGATGLQAAVIENGRLTDVYAYGWAAKGSVPMTPDHKLRIASISKVMVGLTAMRMRQDGLVDLDVPIGTYWGTAIRNPAHPNTPVNLRSLLTHTSSISAAEVF